MEVVGQISRRNSTKSHWHQRGQHLNYVIDSLKTLLELQRLIFHFQGWLKYREKVFEGFEKLPEAFIDMLEGGNIGKAVVKI